jgi:hypothetical protein
MHEEINRAWKRYVHRHIDAANLRETTAEVSDEEGVCFFVCIGQDAGGDPVIEQFEGPIEEDDAPDVEDEKLVAIIPIEGDLTKQALLDADIAHATEWWANPAWSDGEDTDEEEEGDSDER